MADFGWRMAMPHDAVRHFNPAVQLGPGARRRASVLSVVSRELAGGLQPAAAEPKQPLYSSHHGVSRHRRGHNQTTQHKGILVWLRL